MKDKMQNKYVAWGMTFFCVCAGLMILFFALYRWHHISSLVSTIINILMPFIYGLAIAYLMNPVVKFLENKIFTKLKKKADTNKKYLKVLRVLSLGTSTIIFVGVIFTCMSFLFPEILKSIEMLITNINIYLNNTKEFVSNLFGDSVAISNFINDNYGRFAEFLTGWLNDGMLNDVVTKLGNGIFGTLKVLYNIILGYVVAIYILFDKEKFKAQIKKLLYTFFDNDRVNWIIENTLYTDQVFGEFLSGKLIDSLIIGIICFVFMLLFKMPYALIVSVIVGVTNIIPYFGPFIGAIPSAFLILLVSPGDCVGFLIFIFILQQIDGNIIGPKILGGKIGLSSFWVLFSLLIFGGLFGIVGMIIGVPIFSIVYSFVNGLIKKKLEAKHLPLDSKDYENILYVDEKTGKPVYGNVELVNKLKKETK